MKVGTIILARDQGLDVRSVVHISASVCRHLTGNDKGVRRTENTHVSTQRLNNGTVRRFLKCLVFIARSVKTSMNKGITHVTTNDVTGYLTHLNKGAYGHALPAKIRRNGSTKNRRRRKGTINGTRRRKCIVHHASSNVTTLNGLLTGILGIVNTIQNRHGSVIAVSLVKGRRIILTLNNARDLRHTAAVFLGDGKIVTGVQTRIR